MNQRITQLAEQAGYSKDYLEIGLPSNMEKFAKLIIQECIEINKQELSFTAFERLMNKYHDLLLNENQDKV
jgi:hypothetical protein